MTYGYAAVSHSLWTVTTTTCVFTPPLLTDWLNRWFERLPERAFHLWPPHRVSIPLTLLQMVAVVVAYLFPNRSEHWRRAPLRWMVVLRLCQP